MFKRKKGLTLIELLAVIAIIAILFVLMMPMISSSIEKAREAGIMTDFRSYQIAFKSYYMENPEGEKVDTEVNKYLDKSLHFDGHTSKEETPHGWNYLFDGVTNEIIRLSAFSPHDEEQEYGMLMIYRDGEIHASTYGFRNNLESEYISEKTTEKGIKYIEKNDKEVVVSGYEGFSTDVVIPEKIEGKTVTEIGGHAFSYHVIFGRNFGVKLTSVQIPETVEMIWDAAFEFNNIEEINELKNVRYIGDWAFYGNRIEEVTLSESLTEIGTSAFQENEIKNIVIPMKVEQIGNVAFRGNPIENVYISRDVRVCTENYEKKCTETQLGYVFENNVNIIYTN